MLSTQTPATGMNKSNSLAFANHSRFGIYITTYKRLHQYGGASGEWFYLEDYTNSKEFHTALKKYFKDEKKLQYVEIDCDSIFTVSYAQINDDLFEFIEEYNNCDNPQIVEAYYNATVGDLNLSLIEQAEERYFGEFEEFEELGRYCIAELGFIEIPDNISYYFDYEKFGRDLSYNFYSYDNHYFHI